MQKIKKICALQRKHGFQVHNFEKNFPSYWVRAYDYKVKGPKSYRLDHVVGKTFLPRKHNLFDMV
jgi:hypothetical protein